MWELFVQCHIWTPYIGIYICKKWWFVEMRIAFYLKSSVSLSKKQVSVFCNGMKQYWNKQALHLVVETCILSNTFLRVFFFNIFWFCLLSVFLLFPLIQCSSNGEKSKLLAISIWVWNAILCFIWTKRYVFKGFTTVPETFIQTFHRVDC